MIFSYLTLYYLYDISLALVTSKYTACVLFINQSRSCSFFQIYIYLFSIKAVAHAIKCRTEAFMNLLNNLRTTQVNAAWV